MLLTISVDYQDSAFLGGLPFVCLHARAKAVWAFHNPLLVAVQVWAGRVAVAVVDF